MTAWRLTLLGGDRIQFLEHTGGDVHVDALNRAESRSSRQSVPTEKIVRV